MYAFPQVPTFYIFNRKCPLLIHPVLVFCFFCLRRPLILLLLYLKVCMWLATIRHYIEGNENYLKRFTRNKYK